MKTKNRVLSLFLAVLMFVTALPLTALQVSAARTLSYIPEITSIDMDDYEAVLNDQDQVRYLYAYANDDIYSEYDCTIEWDDVCDYYYLVIKFLDGNPAPGGDTSSETGYTWIVKEKKDHYEKNSITIPQSVLDKYAGKYMKVCIVGHDYNGDGTHRCDSYIYVDDGLEFDFSDFSYSQEITLGENLTWSGEVTVNDYLNLDAVSISIKKPDGSAIYYRETDIGNDWFFTEDIQDGCIPTNDVAPTGVFPNGEGGYDKVCDFIIDEPGTYELYVSASIENGQYTKQKYQFTVVQASSPSFSVKQDAVITCDWNSPFVPDVQITQGSGGPITKVTVALYTQKENNSGAQYFKTSFKSGKSYVDLLEIMKDDEIVWGEKVTSATSGQDFDTNTLTDQAYIYIWVVDGDGTHTRGYHLKFNNKPTTFSVGQDEVVTCDWDTPYVPDVQIAQGSSGPITKVSVALYTQKANNSGVKYFTESFDSGKNYVDLLEIMEDDEIVWGEEVASNVSGGIFDTNNLGDQAYIYIWAVDKSGTTHTCGYYLDFINKPAVSQTVGDINGDGEITNKDRFLLNRFVAGMAGYTNINKTVADINGDGSVTDADVIILERHLFGWIGYENLDVFHNTTTVSPTNVPKWNMSFSSNAVTIELVLKEGTLDVKKNYLFIAENSRGLHYTGIIDAGQTSASFSVKAMQMPRGEMYSYYIIPEGVVLAGNKDTYCIGKGAVPLFNGNMITSVKSGGRTIAKNGHIFVGDGLTINWDGSYGVDNFKLIVALNGSEIYNQTFNHDGPGTVTISADKISAKGSGTLVISGYVEPSAASGLATAVSVWTGNVVDAEKETDIKINPVDLLNEDALTLYNKNEAAAYLQLETYYYWQAFADELESGKYWESYRADISNFVNGILSTPTTWLSSGEKSLIKQAIKTKLLAELESEEEITTDIVDKVEAVGTGTQDVANEWANFKALLDLRPLYKGASTISDSELLGVIKKVDLRSFNNVNEANFKDIFNNMKVFYNGKSYNIKELFNITDDDSAVALKNFIKATKNTKSAQQLDQISSLKQMQIINTARFKSAFKLEDLDIAALVGNAIVFTTDMISLYFLDQKFEEMKDELYKIEGASSGEFKEAIAEVIDELRKEYFEQFIGEFMITFVKTGTDLYYGKFITFAAKRINPYVFLAVVSNGIITCLANTNEVNKGNMTLPCIVDAMNNTVSRIAYTYALFMMNPTNTLYYELEALFAAYKFQVELGAEVYMNLSLADHNSYLKRFIRFVNPFDKDDKMPETIQGCYDEDINKKLNFVLTWFGFN